MVTLKPAIKVEIDLKCQRGCGQPAKFKTREDLYQCAEYAAQCPSVQVKNAVAITKAHAEGRCQTRHFLLKSSVH